MNDPHLMLLLKIILGLLAFLGVCFGLLHFLYRDNPPAMLHENEKEQDE